MAKRSYVAPGNGPQIKAAFIGADGSLGYQRGRIYHLRVEGNLVIPLSGPGFPSSCPYGSVAAFLRNWKVLEADAELGQMPTTVTGWRCADCAHIWKHPTLVPCPGCGSGHVAAEWRVT